MTKCPSEIYDRYMTDITASREEACFECAELYGHTQEEAEDCDDGSVGCPRCPFLKRYKLQWSNDGIEWTTLVEFPEPPMEYLENNRISAYKFALFVFDKYVDAFYDTFKCLRMTSGSTLIRDWSALRCIDCIWSMDWEERGELYVDCRIPTGLSESEESELKDLLERTGNGRASNNVAAVSCPHYARYV